MSVVVEITKLLNGKDAGVRGAMALELARRLDAKDETSPAQVSKELRLLLGEIETLPAKVADPLDQLETQRAARRSSTTKLAARGRKAAK